MMKIKFGTTFLIKHECVAEQFVSCGLNSEPSRLRSPCLHLNVQQLSQNYFETEENLKTYGFLGKFSSFLSSQSALNLRWMDYGYY